MRLLAMAGALGALAGVANAQTLYKHAHEKPVNRLTTSASGATKAPNPTRARGDADGLAAWKAAHAVPHANTAPRGVPPANDDCANAQVVFDGRTPYDATGATTDGTNSCGFNNGNDVWFLYTATADGPLNIDCCDDSRSYDTVMSVYTGGCGGTEIACNDDGGPAACYNPGGGGGFGGSNVTIAATAGTQYLIEISCYNSGPAGVDALNIGALQPCVLTPPGPGTPEGEDCGSDTNGGCNSPTPIFGSITCGEVVSGTAWADANVRDTDWYDLTLDGPTTVTVTGQGQFPLQLFILDNNCPPAILAAGNADTCGIATVTANVLGSCRIFAGNSGFTGNPCGAGNDYWIQVTSCDPFQPPVCADCPKGGMDEGEPDCGLPTDTVDGGCNSNPQIFGTISVGGTVCGTAGTANNFRDTDWYQVDIGEGTELTWSVNAEFPVLIGMVAPGCSGGFIGGTAFTADTCVPVSTTKCLAPGTYYMFVAPSGFSGVDCGARYVATLSGIPCDTTPPPNDTCANATSIAVGGSDSGDSSFATADGIVACGTPLADAGVWYTFTGNGNSLAVSLCGSAFDTVIDVYTGTCDNLTCVAGNDDFCGLQSQASLCSSADTTYFVHIGGFGGDSGPYTISILDNGPCPQNDLCSNAQSLAIGETVNSDTSFATDDGIMFCNGTFSGPGLWYAVTGNGNGLSASLCGSAYDTVINVYCGAQGCDNLSCIGGNDDFCGLQSQLDFCSQNGAPYLIHVGGFFGATGPFTLTVSDTGACQNPISCITTGACCTPNGCQIMSPADCAAAGGTYNGDNTNCGGIQTYTAASCGDAFEDISGTGTLAAVVSGCDDCGENIPIGFTFNFFGTDHTDINACSNGYLTFGPDQFTFGNPASLPNPATPNDDIAPYWDDWNLGAGGDVFYQTLGTAPNRRLVVQWQGALHFGTPDEVATFEAILYEGTNNVVFRYAQTDTRDTPAIGLENGDGSAGVNIAPPIAAGTCEQITNTVSPNPCQASCPCDFNHSGSLNSQDFFDFLNCFFTPGCANADFNHSGSVNSQDFFDFLNCFFQPPAGCH